jgi:hypothetical protein
MSMHKSLLEDPLGPGGGVPGLLAAQHEDLPGQFVSIPRLRLGLHHQTSLLTNEVAMP